MLELVVGFRISSQVARWTQTQWTARKSGSISLLRICSRLNTKRAENIPPMNRETIQFHSRSGSVGLLAGLSLTHGRSVSTVSSTSLKQVDGTKDNNLKAEEERENALPSFSFPSALSRTINLLTHDYVSHTFVFPLVETCTSTWALHSKLQSTRLSLCDSRDTVWAQSSLMHSLNSVWDRDESSR